MYLYRPTVNVQPHLSIPPGLVTMHLYQPSMYTLTLSIPPGLVICTCTGHLSMYNPTCPFHLAWLQCTHTNCQCTTPPVKFHPAWLQCTHTNCQCTTPPVHSTWPGYNAPIPTNCQCTTPPCPFHLAWLQCTHTNQLSIYTLTLSIPPVLVTMYPYRPTVNVQPHPIPPGLVTMYPYQPTVNVQPHPVHSTFPGYNVPVLTNCQCTTPPCPFHLAWLQCTCTDQLSMYNPTLSIPSGLVTMYLY